MADSYGDGWNGASTTFTNALGDVIGFFGLETGSSGEAALTVAPYSTDPIFIAGDYTCAGSAIVSDGTGICDLFDDDDVSLEFISEPGLLYYVYVGAQDTDGNPATDDNGAFDLSFTCEAIVEGCTDATACNYNENANLDDGSCDIWSCVCPDSTGTPVQFYMDDSFEMAGTVPPTQSQTSVALRLLQAPLMRLNSSWTLTTSKVLNLATTCFVLVQDVTPSVLTVVTSRARCHGN